MKKAAVPLILVAVVLLTVAVIAEAQQPKKVPRIGILTPGPVSPRLHFFEAFRHGLRDLGYVDGQNIIVEIQSADAKLERLPELAADLVRLQVEIIVTEGTPAAQSAKKVTQTIPIVMATSGNAVRAGLVDSLARPGGNITGLSFLATETYGKRLELLKEIVPKVSRVAVLYDSRNAVDVLNVREGEGAARELGIKLQPLHAQDSGDFERAFSAMTRERAQALDVLQSSTNFTHRRLIADSAAKLRLPTVFGRAEFVDAGGLVSYGASIPDLWRRAATYVDKILKGTKPADLPVEQPMKFELVINLKTAKQIGLIIPQSMLYRADRVIK